MFLKKIVDEFFFNQNGYVLLNTNLNKNKLFNDLIIKIENSLSYEIKKPYVKTLGGYIMGNFGINQGPFASKLFSLVFNKEFQSYFEKITKKKLISFDINFGGNLVLPNKGKQIFHTDGKFDQEMYLVSIATEDITYENGPTEICIGSHLKPMTFDEFFFTKKNKKKITMKKGQILIRKHNLWHRGTKNYTKKTRLLLSFVMMPKIRDVQLEPISKEFKILPNFFKENLSGRLHELIYAKLSYLVIIIKLILSFKTKISKKIKLRIN